MPPKRPPAPIDRPLSKAYLRQFTGWSTDYPPGLSEPNSLRVMHNVQITRDGAARVRPGLRTYMQTRSPYPLVGSHEVFYTEEGRAYLVAVRETVDVGTEDEREIVGFRVIAPDDTGEIVMQTLTDVGFTLASDAASISFTGDTTYVRFLQIDNKIFALPNTPEPMVMFWVGEQRKAKRLARIVRPDWNVADKGTAMHPDSGWVSGSLPSSQRVNRCTNPDFEKSVANWSKGYSDMSMWWSTANSVGSRSLGVASTPTRTNYVTSPLYSPHTTGLHGWSAGPRLNRISVEGTSMRLHAERQATDSFGYVWSDRTAVPGGKTFRFAFDLTGHENAKKWMTAVRFFRSNGDVIGTTEQVGGNQNLSLERKYSKAFTIPSQAAKMRVMIGVAPTASNVNAKMDIKNVTLNEQDVSTAALDGEDGADYYWEGTTNDSRSYYHPGRTVYVDSDKVAASPGSYTGSADVWGSTGVQLEVQLRAYNSSGTLLTTATGTATGTGAWQRIAAPVMTAPTGTTRVNLRVIARDLERAERMYVDAVLLERSGSVGAYFSGATANAGSTKRRWAGETHLSQSYEEVFTPVAPVAETPAASTLVSSTASKNVYSFQFFYTISNDIGESAPSQPVTIRVQRPWTAWEWKNAAGASTDDPALCVDQLLLVMPQAVFDAAVAAGATKWTAYFSTWGPQDVPPVTAVRFAEIDLDTAPDTPDYLQLGYARLTPQQVSIGSGDPLIPTESTRVDSTNPVKGSQGLVAADRLILVGNPADPARITWSSGAPGDYFNFSPLLGGGSKQLTSGNLYLTAAVKLWQNPQSVDTLTILTRGDDGRSNAHYMQPATITSLSETINVMGFEEVTGMDGTVSPYGCEVVNNGLYRPHVHALLKSTANNYNVSTRTMTDTIANMWRVLQSPHRIVSAVLDQRIYYLVHNIFGETLREHCNGNELWVMDLASKEPTWSRWAVQGASLRAMEMDGVVMMSVTGPDGIFVLSPDRYTDDRFADDGTLERVNIPWYLETNTQGANRAHDAWANLQQANVVLGNFLGQMRYGVRGKDVNGMDIDISKIVVSSAPPPDLTLVDDDDDLASMPTLSPTDQEDFLMVRKLMKEWVFYARSVDDEVAVVAEGEEGDPDETVLVPRSSGGQVNFVQYRYTPATVNVGYEYGSVETFEYGTSALEGTTTDSGTPKPYVDRQP